MGYAVLWLSGLVSGLLLVATVAAFSARLKRRWLRILLTVAAMVPPFAVGAVGTFFAGYLRARGIPHCWFGYSLSWTILFVAGAVLLVVLGMSGRGGAESAPQALAWPAKKLAAGLSISLLLYFGTLLYMDAVIRLELAEIRSDARAIALSVAPERVPYGKNAAPLYRQAFEVMGDPQEWHKEAKGWSWKIDQPDFDPTSHEVENVLASRRREIDLLRQAVSMPGFFCQGGHACPYRRTHLDYVRWTVAANLLTVDARHRASKGDMPGALEDVSALWTMARHLSTEPGVLPCMIVARLDWEGSVLLERLLGTGAASAADLHALSRRREIPFRQVYARALSFEEAAVLEGASLGGLDEYSIVEGVAFYTRDRVLATIASTGILWRTYMLPYEIRTFRKQMREARRVLMMPYREAQDQAQRLMESREEMSILAMAFAPRLVASRTAFTQTAALHRLALLAVAAVAYRAAKGEYPGALDELVPDYIPALPTDPFDGEPLRILAVDDGLVLYSVGINCEDDGGDGKEVGTRGCPPQNDYTFCLGSAYEERRLKPGRDREERAKARKRAGREKHGE